MSDREDREIKKVRLRLLDLLKSFFYGEPDAEKMSRWRGTFSALTKESVNPIFDKSALDILTYLEENSLETLQKEYYKLFTDPFTDKGLSTSASQYLDGRTHGQTLVKLRSLLTEIGVVKNQNVIETEDSLVVLLDIYHRLIEEEDNLIDGATQKHLDELLNTYLLPFSTKLSVESRANEFACFYKACVQFFCGYLAMEKELTGTVVSPS